MLKLQVWTPTQNKNLKHYYYFFLRFFIRNQHLQNNLWVPSGKVQRQTGGETRRLKSVGLFGSMWCVFLRRCCRFAFSFNYYNAKREKKIIALMCFPIFLLPNVFLCPKELKAKSSERWFAPVWDLPVQMKHDNHIIFPVPNVDLLCSECSAVLQLICIAIIMEWRRVETSKTLFYLRTVTCRDAPIQIKYHQWTKFP